MKAQVQKPDSEGAKSTIVCETLFVAASKTKASEQSPVVTFRETSAGRETLAAIAEDHVQVRSPLAYRGPETTKGYGDRISNAPGAVSPKVARALDGAPEVTFKMVPAGLRTYHAISGELSQEAPDIEVHEDPEPETSEEINVSALGIERGHPFVVRVHANYLKRARIRKRLLETRLLPAMGGITKEDVTRLTVEALDGGSSLVTVWARVETP